MARSTTFTDEDGQVRKWRHNTEYDPNRPPIRQTPSSRLGAIAFTIQKAMGTRQELRLTLTDRVVEGVPLSIRNDVPVPPKDPTYSNLRVAIGGEWVNIHAILGITELGA
jgi:hypothetical protein